MNQFDYSLTRITFMSIMLLLIATYFLSGCQGPKGDTGDTGGTGPVGPSGERHPSYYRNFDPELRSLVRDYEAHLGSTAAKLNSFKLVPQIKVYNNGKLIVGVVGVCFKSATRRTSEIESDYWWGQYRSQVKLLGYHELAHCVQDAPHKTGSIGDSCPSMMNPYIPVASTIVRCWDRMIDDLFDNKALELDNHHDDCYDQPDGSTACVIRGKL